MTNPRGGTRLQMGSPGDQCYTHQHIQTGVKSGQYLPPVKRDFIYSNLDQMRFMERIQDEGKCKDLWQSKMGKYLFMGGGPDGPHFSEFGQRRFNLNGQIKQPFIGEPAKTFFESMEHRRAGPTFKPEDSKACYERQTGLHFRNPMPSENAGRLRATDNSNYSTPTFSFREARARKARSLTPRAKSQPFYLDNDRFRESWPYSAEIPEKGRQVWWRRHYSTDQLSNTDYPAWEFPRFVRSDGFRTRGSCTCGQNGGPPAFSGA